MIRERTMVVVLILVSGFWAARDACAQMGRPNVAGTSGAVAGGGCAVDGRKESAALDVLLKSVQRQLSGAANVMPADKYGFAPTDGEFKGVRTFGQQVKHLAATNHILAAAALGEPAPMDAGDETGPATVRTKAEILAYLEDSFAHLSRGVDAIGRCDFKGKTSPISPLRESTVTRESLLVEALIHAFDHYGQMVVYLRMNGVVPPASLP